MESSNPYPTPKFNLGDCVKLSSSSQKMTITWINKHPDYGKVINRYTGFMECSWFDGLQLQQKNFHQDALIKCDDNSASKENDVPKEDPVLKTMAVVINKGSRS